MKFAFQAAAAVLSAGAYGLVKAQEEKEKKQDATANLRRTTEMSAKAYSTTEKHGARRLQTKCSACHSVGPNRELQGVPSNGRLLVGNLIKSFTEVCPFDTKGIPGAHPMTDKFVAPEMDKDTCDCCVSDHHGGKHWTEKTLSKFLQEDVHHGILSDLHTSHVASRIVKTHCPKQKRGKERKTNKSPKSKGGKGAKGGKSNEDLFE